MTGDDDIKDLSRRVRQLEDARETIGGINERIKELEILAEAGFDASKQGRDEVLRLTTFLIGRGDELDPDRKPGWKHQVEEKLERLFLSCKEDAFKEIQELSTNLAAIEDQVKRLETKSSQEHETNLERIRQRWPTISVGITAIVSLIVSILGQCSP